MEVRGPDAAVHRVPARQPSARLVRSDVAACHRVRAARVSQRRWRTSATATAASTTSQHSNPPSVAAFGTGVAAVLPDEAVARDYETANLRATPVAGATLRRKDYATSAASSSTWHPCRRAKATQTSAAF